MQSSKLRSQITRRASIVMRVRWAHSHGLLASSGWNALGPHGRSALVAQARSGVQVCGRDRLPVGHALIDVRSNGALHSR
jgi:hypothetical protein